MSPLVCVLWALAMPALGQNALARLWHGTLHLPRAAVEHWRVTVPLLVGTGALIAFADAPASRRIQSPALERASNRWSTRGLVVVQPAVLLATAVAESRCLFCRPIGRTVLDAGAAEVYATASAQALKYAAGRERPYTPADGDGGFNEGGASFPSGHALGAFTLAALQAARYPSAHWANAGQYAVAGGVDAARFTAKKHFLSDLLVGSALGVLTGNCAVRCR